MRVLEVVAAPESGRVFVHCRDGLDRTGTVVALYRIGREGWTFTEALNEAERQGMRRIQYWMRDYVEDYGLSIGKDDEVAGKHLDINKDSALRLVKSCEYWRKIFLRCVRLAKACSDARPGQSVIDFLD